MIELMIIVLMKVFKINDNGQLKYVYINLCNDGGNFFFLAIISSW